MAGESENLTERIQRLSEAFLADDDTRAQVMAFLESFGELLQRSFEQTSVAEAARRRVLPRITRQLTAIPEFGARFQLDDLTNGQRDAVVSAAVVRAADDFMRQNFRNLGVEDTVSREEIRSLSGSVPAVSYTWGVIYGELGELYAAAEQVAEAEMGGGSLV